MRARTVSDNSNAALVDINTTCQITNLGKNTVRRLAKDSKSEIKIGRTYRINIQKLLSYINEEYSI